MERFISVEIFREKGNTCRRNSTEIFPIIWSICVDPIRFFGVEKKLPVPFAVFVRKFSLKGKFHEICPVPTRSVVLDISSLKCYWRNVT